MVPLEYIRMNFGEKPNRAIKWIKERLYSYGWSKETLAKESGIDRRTIHRILNGETQKPNETTLEMIAIAMHKEQKKIQPSLSCKRFLHAWAKYVETGENALDEIFASKERFTVWLLGSYSELTGDQRDFAEKLISIISSSLAELGVRVVMGESDMLIEFAKEYRKKQVASSKDLPPAIVLYGKLRQRNLNELFMDTIGCIPNIAIIIGGGTSGRVEEEYCCAVESNIPVIPIPSTGGAAKQIAERREFTDDRFKVEPYRTIFNISRRRDVGDTAEAIKEAIQTYMIM